MWILYTHRLAEENCENFPSVNKLISNVEKVFVKAPLRVGSFKDLAPLGPLLSKLVITIRGMAWCCHILYYKIVNGLIFYQGSRGTAFCSLSKNIAYINTNFGWLGH